MPLDFAAFNRIFDVCCNAAAKVHDILLGRSLTDKTYCFKILLDGRFSGKPVKNPRGLMLSISVPPDANDWYINKGSYPSCIETALYIEGSGVVYDESLGYSDVVRLFEERGVQNCVPQLIKEIKRIETLLQ